MKKMLGTQNISNSAKITCARARARNVFFIDAHAHSIWPTNESSALQRMEAISFCECVANFLG